MIFRPFHKRNALRYKDNTGQRAMKVPMISGSLCSAPLRLLKACNFYPNTLLFAEERFIALKVKEMKLNNYILLDEIICITIKTINTVFNVVQK